MKKISIEKFIASDDSPLRPVQHEGFRAWVKWTIKLTKLKPREWVALADSWIEIENDNALLVSRKTKKEITDIAVSLLVSSTSRFPTIMKNTVESSVATLTRILVDLEDLESDASV